jgi:hypothetical protein
MRAVFGLVVVALIAASGCRGSSTSEPQQPTATSADPLPGAGTGRVTTKAGQDGTALLERVTVGHHEGFDRIVFQFENHRPGYTVEYASPPLHEDGSGDVVNVDGNAFLAVRMEPASGFDLNTGEGRLVYRGPRRINGSETGASTVREVVRTGDFEAVLNWAAGVRERAPFRVTELDDPARLVVDVRDG